MKKFLLGLVPNFAKPALYRFIISPVTLQASRFSTSWKFFRGVWLSFESPRVGLIPVTNMSGGLLKPLVEPWIQHGSLQKVLLVSEPESSILELDSWIGQNFPDSQGLVVSTLEKELGVEWSPQDYFFDLTLSNAIPTQISRAYDLVVCQSLLEHVGDPVAVLNNLLVLLRDGSSILAIQTCNPFMSLHRFPIDTLRFFPDFFCAFAETAGLQVIVKQNGASIYAFFAESFDDAAVASLESLF